MVANAGIEAASKYADTRKMPLRMMTVTSEEDVLKPRLPFVAFTTATKRNRSGEVLRQVRTRKGLVLRGIGIPPSGDKPDRSWKTDEVLND